MALNRRIAVPLNAKIALSGINDTSVPIGGGGVPPPDPFERIPNPTFTTADDWNDGGGGWVIGLGVASNVSVGAKLTTTLIEPVTAGLEFVLSIDVVDNSLGTGWVVRLQNSGTMATQLVYQNMGSAVPGTVGSTGTVSGTFDEIFIRTGDDSGLVIDNVSFLA
jgi:hypothetical protein